MNIQSAIIKVLDHHDLTAAEMQAVMLQLMRNEASPTQMAAFLVAMRMKGETVTELFTAAQVMQQFMIVVDINSSHLIDTAGTGGDSSQTFNVSTLSSFVAAAAGAVVAKHGNKGVSSNSGSANVLTMAGANLELTPSQVIQCIKELGISFMFAPLYHPAMKAVAPIRKELGVRTFFNLLGPLANPAKVPNLVLGVFAKKWQKIVAEVAQRLNYKHVLVIHSDDGLDEISIAALTNIVELQHNKITTYTISPEQFGLPRGNLKDIQVENAEQSLQLVRAVLDNQEGAAKNIVLLNAGAALYTAGVTADIKTGIEKAKQVIENGAAKKKFADFIVWTNS